MTIEEDFYAAMTSGSPSIRAYPEALPQKATLPAATYTMVGGYDDMNMTGIENTGSRVVQVDAWASSRLSADNLMGDIQTRLLAATTFVVVDIQISGAPRYESETDRYRASKEFTIRFD